MLKVMIVDDEPVERMALQSILENGLQDIEIVGQAEDGWNAIQMAEQLKPDLVLMDIKMPGLDGIEVVKVLHEKYSEMSFVMVSAYDTFHFAQEALRLQVRDYLLKPSTEEDIVRVIGKIVADIKRERAERNDRLNDKQKLQRLLPILETDLVSQLLFDHVPDVRLDELLQMLSIPKNSEVFVMVLFLQQGPEVSNEENDQLYQTLKTEVLAREKGWIGAMTARTIPIILFRDLDKNYRAQGVSCVRKMMNFRNRYKEIDFFIGIGGPCLSLGEIRHSYQEALKASRDLTLPSGHCFYEDIHEKVSDDLQMIRHAEKEILGALEIGNTTLVNVYFERLLDQLLVSGQNLNMVKQQLLDILYKIHKIVQGMGVKAEQPFIYYAENNLILKSEASNWLDRLMDAYDKSTIQNSMELYQKMRKYIIHNAHRNISLESLADYLKLSPYYVSKIFKEYSGHNYIDFLTEYRIEKAKKLMTDPSKSMKEIAYDVGYHDPNYFSRVFKKVAGYSPSDYKNRFPQKNTMID